MENLAKNCAVAVSTLDPRRPHELLLVTGQSASRQLAFPIDLEAESHRASIVPPEQTPPYVVAINTRLKLLDTSKAGLCTFVFPVEGLEEGEQLMGSRF